MSSDKALYHKILGSDPESLKRIKQLSNEVLPLTAGDVLRNANGNITQAAKVLGITNATLRKHRDNDTLDDIIFVNGEPYRKMR